MLSQRDDWNCKIAKSNVFLAKVALLLAIRRELDEKIETTVMFVH